MEASGAPAVVWLGLSRVLCVQQTFGFNGDTGKGIVSRNIIENIM